jgi:ATP synthase protein I
MSAPDPDDLSALGSRIDEIQKQRRARDVRPPPTQAGIAFRFATELVLAVAVGAAMGWGIDWLTGRYLGWRPMFIVVFGLLGAAAGIRNVVRAAEEINAQIASAPKDDEET